MFITTLPEVARLTAEVAKPVARIHRLKIAIITDESQDPGKVLQLWGYVHYILINIFNLVSGVSFYEKFSRKKVLYVYSFHLIKCEFICKYN